MGTYYIAQGGTAANKAAATGVSYPDDYMTAEVYGSEAPYSPGDNILFSDKGGDIQRLDEWGMGLGNSGISGNLIMVAAAPGETPVLTGKRDLTDGIIYRWTATANWTSSYKEYFCELIAGGDASFIDSHLLLLDGVAATESNGQIVDPPDIGSLNDLEWGFGNDGVMGFDSFIFRDETGDPDTSGVLIEAPQIGCFTVYTESYVLVDGLTVKHGCSQNGSLMVVGCENVTVQSCTATWNGSSGINLSGCTDSVADGCTLSYNGAHNLLASGATRITFSNSVTHHCRVTGFSGTMRFDGYGLKFGGYTTFSKIYRCHSYLNDLDGIDLDHVAGVGADDNEMYENLIHDNWQCGILIEQHSHRNKVYLNRIYDNNTIGHNSTKEISIIQFCYDTEIYSNIVFKTKANAGGPSSYALIVAAQYSDFDGCYGTLVYGNTLHGGGYSSRGILLSEQETPKNSKIFNNIIAGLAPGGYCWQAAGTDFTGFDADYNCMIRGAIPDYIVKYGPGYGTQYTLAGIRGLGFETNGMEADPKFTDPDNYDFTLASDSPCIDRGFDLGPPYNVLLMPDASWPDDVKTGDPGDY